MATDWKKFQIRELLFTEFTGDWGEEPDGQKANAVVIRSTNIDDQGHINYQTGAERYIDPPKLLSRKLEDKDIILEVSGGSTGKPVGRVGWFEHVDDNTYIVSNFFRTLRPNDLVDNRFLFWRLLWFWKQNSIWGYQQQTTNIKNLKVSDYLSHNIRIPSLSNQKKMSDILDNIDEVISITEIVIKKLKQIKQGLLHDLLTRGLGVNGELRDPKSNPEQFIETELGLFPKDWKVYKLDDLAYFEMGQSPLSEYVGENQEGLPFLQGNAEFGTEYPSPKEFCSEPKKLCEKGDILISVRAPVGDLNIANQQYVIGRGLAAIRFNKVRTKFSWYLMNHWVRNFHRVAQGSTFKAISKGDLEELKLVLPTEEEQEIITERLDELSRSVEMENIYLDKIKNIKQGLMDDLLTGKVRVSPEKIT